MPDNLPCFEDAPNRLLSCVSSSPAGIYILSYAIEHVYETVVEALWRTGLLYHQCTHGTQFHFASLSDLHVAVKSLNCMLEISNEG